MPETVSVTVYKFDELSEDAKERALNDYRADPPYYDWWNEDDGMTGFTEAEYRRLPKGAETLLTYKTINKQIRDFSSGMKQRVKLAQAILSNSPLLLLDEPVEPGDYLIVQAQAFAVRKIDPDEALEAYRLFDEIIEALPSG